MAESPTTDKLVSETASLPDVAGYEILGELGRWAVGVVYRARHLGLNRLVALKMILAGPHLSPEAQRRFQVEAQAIARLKHPNIVQVYEVGEHAGIPYLCLELVEGANLAAWLAGAPQPAAEAARMVATLAGAVECAHRQGVIHRDLKPANVLLDADGTLKITDFGLAKLLPLPGVIDDQVTKSGFILGTPAYIAPEQARGEGSKAGPAADIYSLGAILYELLTGRPPFQGASPMETLLQAAHQEPLPVTRLVPRVPRDLDTICLKCLEKDAQKRYATAADLAADLGRFLNHTPILARPIGPLGRLGRWSQRNPVPASLASALLVMAIVSFVAITWQWRQARALALSEATANAAAQKERRIAQHESARLILDRARTLCERGDVGPGLLWLARGLKQTEEAGDASLLPSFRANLATWLERLVVRRGGPPLGSSVTSLAFHSDGRRLLVAQVANLSGQLGPGVARVWDSVTWRQLGRALEHPGMVSSAVFSPDCQLILTGGSEGTALLWQAETGFMKGAPLQHAGQVCAVAFAPDGQTLATGTATAKGGEARVWRTATAQPLTPPLAHDYPVLGLAFSPDGKTLLTGSGAVALSDPKVSGEARLWDVASGRPAGPILAHSDPVAQVVFSPHGRTVLTTSRDGLVRQWNPVTGQRIGSPLRHLKGVTAAALSPDGGALLTGGGDWYMGRGVNETALTSGHTHECAAYVWDVGTATLLAGPLAHPDYVHAVAFQPDGKGFATGCRDGRVRLWTSLASRNRRSFALDASIRQAAFSWDGRYLVIVGEKTIERGTPSTSAVFDEIFGGLWLLDVATGKVRGLLPEHKLTVVADNPGPEGRPRTTGRLPEREAPESSVDTIQYVACSPSGPTAVTTGRDGFARLWDLTTGRLVGHPLEIGGVTDTRASFSSDGRRFVTSCKNGPARVWDSAGGDAVFPALLGSGTASVAIFSPDDLKIATGGKDGVIELWDATTGQFLARFAADGGEVRALSFSHGGRILLAGCDGYALRFDALTGNRLGSRLQLREPYVWETAFSPDDARFLTLSGDAYRKSGLMQIWEADSGRPLGIPMLDVLLLPAATFSPDGRFIATGDWEGKARLWDAKSATPIGPALNEPGPIHAVAFSPDGRTLAVGALDGTLTLWPIPAPVPGDPERIRVWLEWLTGNELDEPGVVYELSDQERASREQALRSLGGPPLTTR